MSIAFRRILSLRAQLVSRQPVEKDEVAGAELEFERGSPTLRDLVETRI